MKRIGWARVLASGILWAVVYGLAWGVAWFAFMRAEWFAALAASDRRMPWTEIWTVWAVLNVPLGVATMAYVANRSRSARAPRPAVAAALVLWLPMTLGMAGWGWYESMSLWIIVIDSTVNFAGLAIASLTAEWGHRRLFHRRQPPDPV